MPPPEIRAESASVAVQISLSRHNWRPWSARTLVKQSPLTHKALRNKLKYQTRCKTLKRWKWTNRGQLDNTFKLSAQQDMSNHLRVAFNATAWKHLPWTQTSCRLSKFRNFAYLFCLPLIPCFLCSFNDFSLRFLQGLVIGDSDGERNIAKAPKVTLPIRDSPSTFRHTGHETFQTFKIPIKHQEKHL